MRHIAFDQHLSAIDKLDVARYMYARSPIFTPGTNSKYFNFCYLLASAVVEKVTGMNYFDYLETKLFRPTNITDVEVWPPRVLRKR
jgi:CubicO group peptidase (beta-lactamase class C family)